MGKSTVAKTMAYVLLKLSSKQRITTNRANDKLQIRETLSRVEIFFMGLGG